MKHQDIIWLAGQVFLFRDFVDRAEGKGLDAVMDECPYGDLTEQERQAFKAAFENPRLREVVKQWWTAYDEARQAGELEGVSYWEA